MIKLQTKRNMNLYVVPIAGGRGGVCGFNAVGSHYGGNHIQFWVTATHFDGTL